MDDSVSITVSNLSKMYKVYSKPSDMLWESVLGGVRHEEYWALTDINFAVGRGEIVGVIGRNGAGKSTLLSIVAETLTPTSGSVDLNGDVAAILELGTGFNNEYSGRDNIRLGGLCMGMSRQAIDSKVDDIIRFSELDRVVDQPLKTYSTGMRMRLAFSTAMSADASVFVIDEALAVGDALFQAKCMDKLLEIRESGATIFFVSHNIGTIHHLCSRALLLDRGHLMLDGTPQEVGYAYEALLHTARGQSTAYDGGKSFSFSVGDPTQAEFEPSEGETAIADLHTVDPNEEESNDCPTTADPPVFLEGDNEPEVLSIDIERVKSEGAKAYVESVAIHNTDGLITTNLASGKYFQIRVRARLLEDVSEVVIGFHVEMPSGLVLFGTSTFNERIVLSGSAGDLLEARFAFQNLLGQGLYLVGVGVAHVVDGASLLTHSYRRAFEISVHGDPWFEGPVKLTHETTAFNLSNLNST